MQKMNEAAVKNTAGENDFDGESKSMKQSQRNTDYNLCLKVRGELIPIHNFNSFFLFGNEITSL